MLLRVVGVVLLHSRGTLKVGNRPLMPSCCGGQNTRAGLEDDVGLVRAGQEARSRVHHGKQWAISPLHRWFLIFMRESLHYIGKMREVNAKVNHQLPPVE